MHDTFFYRDKEIQLTIEWRRQDFRKIESAELSWLAWHSKYHGMFFPLQPIIDSKLSEQVLDIWVSPNLNQTKHQ